MTRQTYMRIVKGHFDGIHIWIREVVFRPSCFALRRRTIQT